jgi:hypothetical protein
LLTRAEDRPARQGRRQKAKKPKTTFPLALASAFCLLPSAFYGVQSQRALKGRLRVRAKGQAHRHTCSTNGQEPPCHLSANHRAEAWRSVCRHANCPPVPTSNN